MPTINTINVWTNEDLEKAAKENLGEDKGRLKDDAYLTMFLRGCKFSLERTKEKLDFHHTVRGNLPSWFDSWDPRQPQLQAILKAGMYLPLKGYDRHGRRVILMRAGGSDPNTMKKEEEFKVSTMVMEHAMDG